MDPSSRPPRKVSIADHIWQAYEDMASQMGSDRDALINQAMFMFARLNGFLETGVGSGAPSSPPPGPRPVPVSNGTPAPRAPAPAARAAPPILQPAPRPPPRAPEPAPVNSMDDDPVRREVQERVLETAAELERRSARSRCDPGGVDRGACDARSLDRRAAGAMAVAASPLAGAGPRTCGRRRLIERPGRATSPP
jgi:hypothetical protein